MLGNAISLAHLLLSFHVTCWLEQDLRSSLFTRSFTSVYIDSNTVVVSLHVENINIRIIDVEAPQVVNIKLYLSSELCIFRRRISIVINNGVPVVRPGVGLLSDN